MIQLVKSIFLTIVIVIPIISTDKMFSIDKEAGFLEELFIMIGIGVILMLVIFVIFIPAIKKIRQIIFLQITKDKENKY